VGGTGRHVGASGHIALKEKRHIALKENGDGTESLVVTLGA
jgi:hypothetical protein